MDLPEVEAPNISASDAPVVVTRDRKRRLYINDAHVKRSDLRTKLAAIRKLDNTKAVLLRADEDVPYGEVMQAMSDIRQAGITKVGMVTEPVGGR